MTIAAIGLVLGIIIGAGFRFFDIPSPAPPRLIGSLLLLAMTLGFIAAGQLLPAAQMISRKPAVVQMVTE
jgi:XapX domain-containing protein